MGEEEEGSHQSREPDAGLDVGLVVGLDPRTLGSRPEPKADA